MTERKMVVVSHLFFYKKVRARCGSCEPFLALSRTIYFPTVPLECPICAVFSPMSQGFSF